MTGDQALGRTPVQVTALHAGTAGEQGLAAHPHLKAVLTGMGRTTGRDFADAVHLLCALHGQHPGLVEIVLRDCADERARAMLSEPAEAFEQERLYLVHLTAAVGPIPSTPGAAETEASLAVQRHALETLAVSERRGCAIGAACALLADWSAVRSLLDRAADRVGIVPPACMLPEPADLAAIVDLVGATPATQRALAFGAEQLLLQHRGLFDLLEARAGARTGY